MICPTKKEQSAEILLDYCAGTLDPALVTEFEKHLEHCGDCQRLTEAQRAVWQALEQWTPVAVSPDFDARLYARIQRDQAVPEWRLWLRRWLQPAVPYAFWKPTVSLAAACAVLAVGLHLVRTPNSADHAPQIRAEVVDIERVEKTLEDLDMLTPVSQASTSSPASSSSM